MKTKEKFRCILVPVAVTAALLCLSFRSAGNDDAIIGEMAPFDSRLHLLPDSARVEACRSLGYPLVMGSIDAATNLFVSQHGDRDTPLFEYMTQLVEEDADLVARAFGNTARRQAIDAMLHSEEKTATWLALRGSAARCQARIHKQGRSPEIERTLRANIAEVSRVGLNDEHGYFLEVLADYYFSTENDTMGVACLEEAFRCRVSGGNVPVASYLADRIGTHYLRKGDGAAAERWFLTSLRYAREAGDSYSLSKSYSFLANLRREEGRLVEADSLFSEAITYGRRLRDPHVAARLLVDMAGLALDRGERARALTLCQEAIEENGRGLAASSPTGNLLTMKTIRWSQAEAYSTKASIYLDLGKNDDAVAAMSQALDEAKETIDRRFEASLRAKLGNALLAAGRDGEALRSYAKALHTARKLRERDREAEYLRAMAEVHLKRSNLAEAQGYLEDALRAARESGAPERVIPSLARLAHVRRSRGDVRGATALLHESIAIFERERAKRNLERSGRELRDGMETALSELLLIKSRRPAEIDSLLFYAEKARLLLDGATRIEGADLDSLVARGTRGTEWIPENTLVIQHVATPDTLLVIATERTASVCRAVPVSRDQIEAMVSAFVERCIAVDARSDRGIPSSDPRALEAYARDLDRLLLAPIDSLVATKGTLCFIPDGALRSLPFGALIGPGAEPRFLLEDKRILLGTSLASLGRREPHERVSAAAAEPRVRLLIGNPRLGPEVRKRYPYLAELPHAGEEIAEAQAALGGGTLLAGGAATKEAVLAALRRSEMVHVAAHTVLLGRSGSEAAIALSPASNDTTFESAVLSENEIRALDLSPIALVVLASCQSAGSDAPERAGERGIAGAFLDAGTRTVIATLWPVEDSAARRFMRAYYDELSRGGSDAAGSLRAAQERFIRTGRANGNALKEMHVWAPYVCFEGRRGEK